MSRRCCRSGTWQFLEASKILNGNGEWSTQWHQCYWTQCISYPWLTSNHSRNQSSTQTCLNDSNRSTVAIINSAPSLQWYFFSCAPVLFKSLHFLSNSLCGGAWHSVEATEGNWVSSRCVCAVIVLVDFIVEQCFSFIDVLYRTPTDTPSKMSVHFQLPWICASVSSDEWIAICHFDIIWWTSVGTHRWVST